jgi:cold shock CspA family protein
MSEEEKVYLGRVIFFKNSYGFLHEIDEEGNDIPEKKDIFFHFSSIIMPDDSTYKTIKNSAKCTYSLGKNIRGEVIAINVKEIK